MTVVRSRTAQARTFIHGQAQCDDDDEEEEEGEDDVMEDSDRAFIDDRPEEELSQCSYSDPGSP